MVSWVFLLPGLAARMCWLDSSLPAHVQAVKLYEDANSTLS